VTPNPNGYCKNLRNKACQKTTSFRSQKIITDDKDRLGLQLLITESDTEFCKGWEHFQKGRDVIGKLSHLLDGVDLDEFTRDDGEQTPLDAWKKQGRCCS
jgi:hypothetical protein